MEHGVWIVAHRGASAYAPENTLNAFHLAWQMDADAIEGDFRLTADGQIVCIHDASTQRLAAENLPIETTNYARLRDVNIGHSFQGDSSAAHIPLLSEVLETVPSGKKFFIELKSGPRIVAPLIDALNASQLAAEQIILITFNADVLEAIQQVAPHYPTGLIVKFHTSLNGQLVPNLETTLGKAQQLGCSHLHVGAEPWLPHDLGVRTKAHGLQLHAWTVDTAELCHAMRQLGVQSITTNKPDAIRAAIQ
jgi:glycerophosphoryl diester phosphodiesterase